MALAQMHLDRLEDIKRKVKDWHEYYTDNIERFNFMKNVVFNTSITFEDENVLIQYNRPRVEANVLETYISRLRGEYARQNLSPLVNAINPNMANPQLTEFLEGHLRAVNKDANNNQFQNEILNDTLAGGWSVGFVGTEYTDEMAFEQRVKIERVFDPTLCGFDPLARQKTKEDGKYCFELFPMYKEEVEDIFGVDLSQERFVQTFGDFNWFYTSGSRDVALICHFYEKQYKKKRLVYLASGDVMTKDDYREMLDNWTDITEPPAIVKERTTRLQIVCRYTLMGDTVLGYDETNYSGLPYVFFDGNSQMLRKNEEDAACEMTRPLVYHAVGAQRAKNMFMQSFVYEVQNMSQARYILPETAFPDAPQFQDAWLKPQLPSVLFYKMKDLETGIDNAPPMPSQRQPIPPELFQAFSASDETIRNIMSSFDPNVALNSNDISGKAIIEGVAQSNAAAMPYLINYIASLGRMYRLALDLIPKYYVTPMSAPIIDADGKRGFELINQQGGLSVKYNPKDLNVMVDAGVNANIMKSENLSTLANLSQAFPVVAQFINTKGLPTIIKNLDIDGADDLQELAAEFMQEMEQQQAMAQQQGAQQQNPAMMDMQLKAAKIQQEAQKDNMDNQIAQMQIMHDQQRLELDRLKMLMQAHLDTRDQNIALVKSETERMSKAEELAMKKMESRADIGTSSDNKENVQ